MGCWKQRGVRGDGAMDSALALQAMHYHSRCGSTGENPSTSSPLHPSRSGAPKDPTAWHLLLAVGGLGWPRPAEPPGRLFS